MSLRDRRARHDHYHRRARAEGYAARSVYKLQEMDERLGLVRAGDRVLDLGCRPGSWLQYLARRVGRDGRVVGLDRTPVDLALGPNVRVETGDVREVDPARLLGALDAFDLVVSDLAPDTTGARVTDQARSEALFGRALAIARSVLRPGGHFVGKLFQGPALARLRDEMRETFTQVREVKPRGSRPQSSERYLVGLRRR